MKICQALILILISIDSLNSLRLRKAESEVIESTTFGLGKVNTDNFYLNNSNQFRSVEIFNKLPPNYQQGEKIESDVEVIETDSNYYDGTIGFKTTTKVVCGDYTTKPQVCVNQGSCGWCGSSNSCINGNNLGPLMPCVKGTYVFTAPDPSWNPIPNSVIQNVNIGAGAVLSNIVPIQQEKMEVKQMGSQMENQMGNQLGNQNIQQQKQKQEQGVETKVIQVAQLN